MKKLVFAVLLLFTAATVLTGCREKKTTGEKIEDSVENVGDGVEDAADDVGDAVEDAVN